MADKSAIEWTDATWNPVVGCSIVSPGCTNCYAMKMAARIEKMASSPMAAYVNVQTHYAGTTQRSKAGAVWTGKVAQAPEHILLQPLKWKRPRKIFVNSMGDLFHESIPDEWIDRVFAVMALAPQHTFQVLTKRAERMRDYFSHHRGAAAAFRVWMQMPKIDKAATGCDSPQWPLPNVWLGVSAERQEEADERIEHLLVTPAAVRFVSAEPLLGPIDFGAETEIGYLSYLARHNIMDDALTNRIDWVIVGGESGKGARRMHERWALEIRDQCAAFNVPFFFKQWGEHDPETFDRVGKKRAGRLLDGREHSAFPVIDRSVTQSGGAVVESKTAEATAS